MSSNRITPRYYLYVGDRLRANGDFPTRLAAIRLMDNWPQETPFEVRFHGLMCARREWGGVIETETPTSKAKP